MLNMKKIKEEYPRVYKIVDRFLLKQWQSRCTHQISHTTLNHIGIHVAVIETSYTRGSGYSYSDDIEIETPIEDLFWFFEQWGYYIDIRHTNLDKPYFTRIVNPRRAWEQGGFKGRYEALEETFLKAVQILNDETIVDHRCDNCRFWVHQRKNKGICERMSAQPSTDNDEACRFYTKRPFIDEASSVTKGKIAEVFKQVQDNLKRK